MALEDVKVPKRVFNIDPKGSQKKPAEEEYWEKQARVARGKREYMEEVKMTERISDPEPPAEPPFKVTGEVSMGKIDLQEQQREARAAADDERIRAEARITAAEAERDSSRQSLMDAQLSHMKDQLGGQIDQLKGALANGRQDLGEQIGNITKFAEMLGYQKVEAGPTDGSLTLEIKKLEWSMQKESRDFQRQMKKDEREWQLEIKKLDQIRIDSEAKLAQEKERWASFSNIPERLGSVVAQSMAEREGNGGGSVTDTKTYHATAAEGEFGSVPCPVCNAAITVAAETTFAECARCHTKVAIERVKKPSEDEE